MPESLGSGLRRNDEEMAFHPSHKNVSLLAMSAFLVALSFLTVFPSTLSKSPTTGEISASRAFFPLVGLLLGLLLFGLERAASLVFPPFLTAALLIVVPAVVTRGLHLDGFMDVCDGLFGGYTPERRLEIMRDSHVGSFAVAGAIGLLLLKYGALASLLTLVAPGREWVLLLFPVLSRWSMVVALSAFPYVRTQGLGSPYHRGSARMATAGAAITVVGIALLAGGPGGAVMLAVASALAWLLGWGMARMLGGLTGDTYGAINEITEVVSLVAAVALLPYGLIEPLPQLLRYL